MKAMIGRRSLAVRGAVVAAVVAGAIVPLVLGASTPALASTLDGAAVITDTASNPLSSGASTAEFSLALAPTNATPAACSGDTASDGYHVYSYLVQAGTTISSLTFTSHPSAGLGLVNNVGVYYGSANTAIHTGQIVSIPTNFEFGPLVADDGVALSTLLYTGGTTGVWEAGLACATSSGTLSDYWNVPVTFSASGSDPNGFVWSAYQTTPQTAPTTTTASSTASAQLATANATGAVTYSVSSASSALAVSSSGHVTTTGALSAGSYTVGGTDTDTASDASTWSFTLIVSPVTLTQGSPKTGTTTTSTSASFTSQLTATPANGTISYTVTSPSSALAVSGSGHVTTTGSLAAGTYTASGTDADTARDSGAWSFSLTVSAGTLAQAAPTSASVVSTSSAGFTDHLAVTGASGTVTYTVTSPSSGLTVSSSGSVATPGTLATGTYTASGTDADSAGDAGTWSFSLTVSPAPDSFTSANHATATVGESNFTFSVTTYPAAAKLKSSGKLPKGVKFNKATRQLAGTPTSTKRSSAAGVYHLTFTATFGKGKTKVTATQAFTLTVNS
ncbi:MAG TPA: putative Ig domain-containing protein [Acidimicrobiales bacterium]|nr:putative Ig domain-containing protein [Acidimicrobiales bacterium]